MAKPRLSEKSISQSHNPRQIHSHNRMETSDGGTSQKRMVRPNHARKEIAGVCARENATLQTAEPLRLDIGCGIHRKDGFKGVDIIPFPGVDFVLDLKKLWPWKDNSVTEVHCSHTIEHFASWDRVHFINELYRVLIPNGKATIIAPHWSSCRAYGDPSHEWQPCSEFAFFYWQKAWRMANAPHTDIQHEPRGFDCNFDATWGYSLEPGVAMRNQEYQQYAMVYLKEACQDIICTLVKK